MQFTRARHRRPQRKRSCVGLLPGLFSMDRALPGLELAAHKLSEVDTPQIGAGSQPRKMARVLAGRGEPVVRIYVAEMSRSIQARGGAIAVPFCRLRS